MSPDEAAVLDALVGARGVETLYLGPAPNREGYGRPIMIDDAE